MSAMRVLGRAAVLLVLGAVAMPPRAWAQSVVVGPLPSSMSAIPGASITVPVVADLTSSGGASLGSVAVRLTWRPGTLAFVSTGVGALGSAAVNTDSTAQGILKFALANAGGAAGMPVLINATFNVTGAPTDTTIFGVSVTEIAAAGTFADLKPITTATGARFCTSTGMWGDLDADGTFTGQDALIILTSAVGLPVAPYSIANGDVDNNGLVDTRDALIVLSDAVGIPVSQFRIGRINAGICSLRSAAAVQIQPRTPTVAPGDSLPVTATVKDSTGALVQGVGLVWQSKDPAIVRPGAAGSLVAVAPGTTYALVFVQPGVKDSVPVVVTQVRHQWYVNPAIAAANLGVELGSQLYPFSSIDTAMARAAVNDTVHVGVADYGSVHITKALTLLGDSTAAGFPRLTGVTNPALRADSVLGAVTVRGLRLLNSPKGLVAKFVQTLTLSSISVEGSRDLGLLVSGADSVMLSHVSVVGAVSEGIELDSMRVVALDHVRSDAISAMQGSGGPPLALRVTQVVTVNGDSISLGTGGALVDSAGAVTLRHIRVTGSRGPALRVNGSAVSVVGGDFSGATTSGGAPVSYNPMSYTVSLNVSPGAVQLDSSRIHDNAIFGVYVNGVATVSLVSLRADSVARNFSASDNDASSYIYGFGWLRLAHSAFVNNGPGYVDIEGSVLADSVNADSTVFDGTDAYVYNLAAFRMHGGAVRNATAPALEVDYVLEVELDSVEVSGNNISGGFAPAVYVYNTDTTTVNGLNAHDNASGAFEAYVARALRVSGGTMLNNGFGQFGLQSRFTVEASDIADIQIYGLSLRDSTDVGILIAPGGAARTVVDSSALEGSATLIRHWNNLPNNGLDGDTLIVTRSSLTGFGGTSGYGVDALLVAKLVVSGDFMDSLSVSGVQANAVDSTIAFRNTIRAWGSTGINVTSGVLAADSNTFTGCVPFGAAISASQPGTTSIVGNTLNGCGALAYIQGQYASSGSAVTVRDNTLTRDTTTAYPGIYLAYGLGYVQVVGNTIVGGSGDGIDVGGSYGLDSARVDSNTVQQTRASGIVVGNVTYGLSLRYNLVSDNPGYGLLMNSPFTATSNTVVRNSSDGVVDATAGPSAFRLGNVVGNLPYGVMTQASSMQADSTWWGDLNGPTCQTACSIVSVGDSVTAFSVSYSPPLGAPSASAPAIPAPPPAPIARSLASRGIVVPRASRAAAGAQPPRTGPPPAQVTRPVAPVARRPARPTGRQAGHNVPAWRAGVRP